MATLAHDTTAPDPTVDRVALIGELHAIRAWEHRYQDFDSPLAARASQIMALLAAPARVVNACRSADENDGLSAEFRAAFAEVGCPLCKAGPEETCAPDCLCYLPENPAAGCFA